MSLCYGLYILDTDEMFHRTNRPILVGRAQTVVVLFFVFLYLANWSKLLLCILSASVSA